MSGKNLHVTYRKDEDIWAVVRDNYDRASGLFDTKAEAVDAARQYARNDKVELSIHRKDNVITEKESYGNDPCPPKDKEN